MYLVGSFSFMVMCILFIHITDCQFCSMTTDCGLLPSSVGGVITTQQGTTYGKTATITCHAGFTLIGPSSVTCQADGTWSYTPSCERKGNYGQDVIIMILSSLTCHSSVLILL